MAYYRLIIIMLFQFWVGLFLVVSCPMCLIFGFTFTVSLICLTCFLLPTCFQSPCYPTVCSVCIYTPCISVKLCCVLLLSLCAFRWSLVIFNSVAVYVRTLFFLCFWTLSAIIKGSFFSFQVCL